MDKTMDKGLYDHQKRLESLAFALADSVKDASDEEIRVECYESGYEPSEAANRVRTLLLRDKVIMRDTEYAEPTDAKTSAVSDNSDLRWPRLQQLRQRIRQLRNQINATEKRMGALVRQYLILADIHGFEDLDPIDGAVIPRENKVQVAEADRFQRASLAAITLGTAVAAVLSVLSINFPSAILLALGAAGFSALLAVIIVRWISVTIDATPRNPAAEQKNQVLVACLRSPDAYVLRRFRVAAVSTGLDSAGISPLAGVGRLRSRRVLAWRDIPMWTTGL